MITGAIKNKVDKIWTDIWAGGLTNPLTVIEQLTYLIFIRSLDEKEIEYEQFDHDLGIEATHIFPKSAIGQAMRWGTFKNRDPQELFDIIQRYGPSLGMMSLRCAITRRNQRQRKYSLPVLLPARISPHRHCISTI